MKFETDSAYPVRAHHAFNQLVDLVNTDPTLSPELAAAEQARRSVRATENVFRVPVAKKQDTMGNTPVEAERFGAGLREGYLEFVKLPDSAPVEIVARPDRACGACIVGHHCWGERVASADRLAMSQLLNGARHKGLGSGFEITKETVDSPKGPVTLDMLRTTAGSLRSLLRRK